MDRSIGIELAATMGIQNDISLVAINSEKKPNLSISCPDTLHIERTSWVVKDRIHPKADVFPVVIPGLEISHLNGIVFG